MVCICVLVYSCFIKNHSTLSWLTTHHFTMGVLQLQFPALWAMFPLHLACINPFVSRSYIVPLPPPPPSKIRSQITIPNAVHHTM
jgi:hypothetical protein